MRETKDEPDDIETNELRDVLVLLERSAEIAQLFVVETANNDPKRPSISKSFVAHSTTRKDIAYQITHPTPNPLILSKSTLRSRQIAPLPLTGPVSRTFFPGQLLSRKLPTVPFPTDAGAFGEEEEKPEEGGVKGGAAGTASTAGEEKAKE
jgi:hypothetical protein